MNWDDLKVLLALSRAGSTRKAAATLGVSNTTVMRRLESLEEGVGGRLFDRTPDGFKETPLGDINLHSWLYVTTNCISSSVDHSFLCPCQRTID